jgi:hypothetical protein
LRFPLPPGFVERLERRDFGGLVVWLADREDMVCFKLYAAADHSRRSRHFQDLQDLNPPPEQLVEAAHWATTHDPSPGFRSELVAVLSALGVPDATQNYIKLHGALLNRAWIQWIALGVDALGESADAVVDPEALVAITAEIGDADVRLLDVSTDWCVRYGHYVSASRLQRVARELTTPATTIGEFAATVAAAGGPAWPLATSSRAGYEYRGKARLESTEQVSRLRIRLRAAFGVGARAEVLAALLSGSTLSLAELTQVTRFTKPAVASAVESLALAGLLERRNRGNQRLATLVRRATVLPGLRPPVPLADWVQRFGVALEVLRFTKVQPTSRMVQAIKAHRLVDALRPRLAEVGLREPNFSARGEDFAIAFDTGSAGRVG